MDRCRCCGLLCQQGDFLTLFEAVVARSVTVEEGGGEEQRPPRQLQAGAQAETPDGRTPDGRRAREQRQTARGPVVSFAQAQREPPKDDDLPGAKVKADFKNFDAQPLAEAEVRLLSC